MKRSSTSVLFAPEVVQQFLDLAEVLYDKGYLGFKEQAIDYAEKLFRSISSELPGKIAKPAPEHFQYLGTDTLYASFRHDRHTVWYVFFSVYNVDSKLVYYVKLLSNNHLVAQHLPIVS